MRTLLLGLPLKQAEAILGEAGISPQVRVTDAPRREKKDGGTLRVVFASDDGKQLVAVFKGVPRQNGEDAENAAG